MSHMALKLETFLKRTNRFTRFLMVGAINTLTGLTIIFMLLSVLGWSYWLSTFIGNSVGAVVSYLLNRSFTFQSQIGFTKGALKFITVILLCYFISYSFSDIVAEAIYIRVSHFPLINQEEFAILLGSGIYTLSNYIGQKNFVFKK